MLTTAARRPRYVFVVWSEARAQERRILEDLATRFRVLDVVEVTWTPDERFARSLTRMYGDALPPGSDKELHCGTGPFLAVVVEDTRPRFGLRRTGRGRRVLNTNVYDARLRYRRWTGGGYRVHASDSMLETERNLVLIFGRGAYDFEAAHSPARAPREHVGDPEGTEGWSSQAQLQRALAAYGTQPLREQRLVEPLEFVSSNVWWAEHIAGGREVGPGLREVLVDGRPVRLRLRQRPSLAVRAATALPTGLLRR